MPEGHTIHRLARDHRALLIGKRVAVSSPQGRFAIGAGLLDGSTVARIEPYGKHLWYRFDNGRLLHIHLGLYGKFATGALPPPDARGALRIRITTDETWLDLRGPTHCDLVTPAERKSVLARLGPDPLRASADPDLAWSRIASTKIAIGQLLMDQSVLAGVGNVYRAEVLFRHRVDPLRPGSSLRRSTFEQMWNDLVALMADGVRRGRIDTTHVPTDPELVGRVPTAATGRSPVFVYRRDGEACFVCGATVRTEVLVGRNLFWCPRCQPRFRSRAGG